VLGSKGSGKSIVVELLRFALDQEPTQLEVRRDHDTKLEKRLMLYGRVKVTVSDDQGNECVIEREYDPANDSPFHGAVADPAGLFPCHFLSQGEIVRIAESEAEQIRFIDSFFDFRTFQRTIDELRNELTAIDQNVAEQIRARTKHRQLDGEAKQLRTQIDQKDKELASPVFAKFQEAQAKDQAAKRALGTLDQLIRTLGQAIHESESVPDPTPLAPPLDADPLLKRMYEAVRQGRSNARNTVEASVEDLTHARTSLQAEYATWQPTFAQVTDEYSREIQKSGGDRPALSQERARLVATLAGIEDELNKAKQVSDLLRPTVGRRNELLEALKQKQADYTTARQQRCDWFEEKSEGQIRAQVSAGVNYSAFRAMLDDMKRGSYLAADQIDKIARNVTPEAFVRSILRYDLSQDPSHLDELATAATLPVAKIQALADFLIRDAGYERLLALEYSVSPEDLPSISFRVEDGSYTPLDELSTGQKCTALLVMALGEGNMPIVVDQPEDSLDIRSIWDDMCVRLRDSKRGRQFLFTTHNSSLAVASDSDKFIVLAADAKKGEAVLSGAIDGDEVRRHVILLLEGGPPTYFLKHRKYNVTDPQAL
jgi:energy-coupling factor transporter ATP-binding protein EcfA2